MKLLDKYRNGNYFVMIFEDGTKIRTTEDDEFIAEFPENIDIKLTNKCFIGCPFCHENSTPDGAVAKLLNDDGSFAHPFFNTLKAGTELALGGGALTTINKADFTRFLAKLSERGIIANITINQQELKLNKDYIQLLINNCLVYGVGVSFTDFSDKSIIEFCQKNPNVVIHVINGVLTKEACESLCNKGLKMLILGFKDFRRGSFYKSAMPKTISDNQKYLYDNLGDLFEKFKVISFDNLALEQLDVKRLVSEKTWNECYMGDDGTATMYIDLVNEKFGMNSTQPEEFRKDLTDDIVTMFTEVKNMKAKNDEAAKQ